MLTSKNITKNQIKKVLSLIDEHARGEVAMRLGLLPKDVLLCTGHEQVRIKDELRELIYGTSDLSALKEVLGLSDGAPITKKRKNLKKRRRIIL